MPDTRRLNFAAPASAVPAGLLDDLLAMAAGLECAELAGRLEAMRSLFAADDGVASVRVSAAHMAPWFEAGSPVPGWLGMTLAVRALVDPDHPSVVTERNAELIVYASPTGSFDVGTLRPLLEMLLVGLGTQEAWPRKSDGSAATAYRMPSGWAALADVLHPSRRYGIDGEPPPPAVPMER